MRATSCLNAEPGRFHLKSLDKAMSKPSQTDRVEARDKPCQSLTPRSQYWPRLMLALETSVATAFLVSVSLFEREGTLPLILYATFWAVALVSTGVGINALCSSSNAWLLFYPAASIALVPCVWLVGVFKFFRFFPD